MISTAIAAGVLAITILSCTRDAPPTTTIPNAHYLERADWQLVHTDELEAYLQDPRLLERLQVENLIVLDAEVDTASITIPSSTRSIGMVYYTIQDGWHLKNSNERMEHKSGKGWLIHEQ